MKSFPLIAILLAAPAAVAQSAEDWNFLSDASIFRDVHGSLPAYLKNKANALLDERERAIARISTHGRSDRAPAILSRADVELPGRAGRSALR